MLNIPFLKTYDFTAFCTSEKNFRLYFLCIGSCISRVSKFAKKNDDGVDSEAELGWGGMNQNASLPQSNKRSTAESFL